MKINLKDITVTGRDHFTYRGRTWSATRWGNSPIGLWNEFTDGKDFVKIYKSDLLKIDKDAAMKLYN